MGPMTSTATTQPIAAAQRIPERPPQQVYRPEPWNPSAAMGYPETATPNYERERAEQGYYGGGGGQNGQIAQLQAAATGRRSDSKGPVEFNHAINYVNKIKVPITLLPRAWILL